MASFKASSSSDLISVSIISHGQADLVQDLLTDLIQVHDTTPIEVFITKNIPETDLLVTDDLPYPIKIIENHKIKGFGENHNAAFQLASGKWFCVINPDIRLSNNPLPKLIQIATEHNAAVIAPAALTPCGKLEDSIRYFPTPPFILKKLFFGIRGSYSFTTESDTFPADWVGGMFMLFRASEFARINGFDEKYFLYYEDVDICTRIWKAGQSVYACPSVQIIHNARRTSRRNPRYLRWHVCSMLRYFMNHCGSLPHSPNTGSNASQ